MLILGLSCTNELGFCVMADSLSYCPCDVFNCALWCNDVCHIIEEEVCEECGYLCESSKECVENQGLTDDDE